MPEKDRANESEGGDNYQREEVTMDTPGPTAIQPPPEAFADMAVETNAVAVPVANNAVSPRTCTVFAPQTIGEGFTFPASVDGIDFVVTVPEGGAREGEPFDVPYPSSSQQQRSPTNDESQSRTRSSLSTEATTNITHVSAPTGRWRNDLFGCCEILCTLMFWQGCCCSVVLLGQVMTRLRLNLCAQPAQESRSAITGFEQTFFTVLFLWILMILLLCLAPEVFSYLLLPFAVYLTILVTFTRHAMRLKYQIPVSDCKDCDGKMNDCCCGFWCFCCVTIQMARHTHDQQAFPYQCCSITGLNKDAPPV